MPELLPWILAAAMLGLWLGERGRRLDAQRREGVIDVDPVPRAEVHGPGGRSTVSEAGALESAREKYIAQCVAEGFNRADAEADFDRMMARAQTDEVGTWGPNR